MTELELVERNPNPVLERPTGECLATWWHQATPGTTYWRCLVPARHLPGQILPVRHDDIQEEDGEIVFPRQRGDTAIWQFLGDEHRTKLAFGMRHVMGTRLLLEIDDDYTRPAPYMYGQKNTPWVKTIAEAHASARSGGPGYSHEMHRLILPHADGIICSTEHLASVYETYNDNVWVCPNSIDPDDWAYEREPHDAFRIVYYGSPSHISDTPLVTKALKWASRQEGVEIWTVGFQNPSWSFPYQTVPWTNDLAEARKNLFRFDLGIAPLKGNPWSRGKSDIKAMEYAMAGVLPLMSYEEPFRPWFDSFPDLCLADGEWEEAIRNWVGSRETASQEALRAREWVLENRVIDETIHKWRQLIA